MAYLPGSKLSSAHYIIPKRSNCRTTQTSSLLTDEKLSYRVNGTHFGPKQLIVYSKPHLILFGSHIIDNEVLIVLHLFIIQPC